MKISLLNKINNSERLNKHILKAINDDTFAAKTLVTLNVAKDIFAYATRFKTTLENKDIPEEQRPFVASMDLASGIVTAIAQIGVGFTLAHPKFHNMLWNKFFKNCKFNDINAAKKGFGQILALAGSTILAERLIVPILATPFAQKMEKKFFTKQQDKNLNLKTNPQIKSNLKFDISKINNQMEEISFHEYKNSTQQGKTFYL